MSPISTGRTFRNGRRKEKAGIESREVKKRRRRERARMKEDRRKGKETEEGGKGEGKKGRRQ